MNRLDLQKLSDLRLSESKALLQAGFPDGAYYLAGYAVECALKACIARQTKQHDFPDKELVSRSYTHKLQVLLDLAKLTDKLASDPTLRVVWVVLKNWSEEGRYRIEKTKQQALELLLAIEDQTGGGFLPWVRNHW
jgi:hypothetical protein